MLGNPHNSVFDQEDDMFNYPHVTQWIACDSHQVCLLAWFDRAYLVGLAVQIRRAGCGGLTPEAVGEKFASKW